VTPEIMKNLFQVGGYECKTRYFFTQQKLLPHDIPEVKILKDSKALKALLWIVRILSVPLQIIKPTE